VDTSDFLGFDLFGFTVGGGIGVGGVVAEQNGFQIIPAVGVLFERARLRLSNDAGSFVDWLNVTTAEIGIGIVLQDRFTIRPALTLSSVEGDTSTGFRLTFLARVGR